jgi:hypothetical protein
VRLESFFDLRIATLEPGEEAPADAHWVRIEEPGREALRDLAGRGWFYKPAYVTWALKVPPTLEDYIAGSFRTGTRNKPRKLLREVPERYRFEADDAGRGFEAFTALYRKTIVGKARGRDRIAEHHAEGFDRAWSGFYLWDGDALAAGILVHRLRDHLSVAYGAFDAEARKALDVEHFLIMKAIERSAERGYPWISLGMDTNRYGHHLPLGLPAYKLRIGFTPMPWEPSGRELARPARFDVFERGLFFFAYGGEGGLEGHYFSAEEPDLRPFRHHTAPPVAWHPLPNPGKP